jgi:hypothetical protein
MRQTPNIICPSVKQVVELCINPKCKNSLKCSNAKCPSCGTSIHKGCPTVPLDELTRIINDKTKEEEDTIIDISQIEKRLGSLMRRGFFEFMEKLIDKKNGKGSLSIKRIYVDMDYHALSGK